MNLDGDAFHKIHPFLFYKKFFDEKVRPDGRPLESSRNVIITPGAISSDGSCIVRIGQTSFITGIRLEVGAITDSKPNGELITKLTLPELASPKFSDKKLRDTIHAELLQHVDSFIHKSDFLDRTQLDIYVKKEKIGVWVLYLDIYCLEDDGACLDSCLLSVIGAVKNLSLPGVKVVNGDYEIDESVQAKPISLGFQPVSTTFVELDTVLLIDPTSDEEKYASTSFTITYDDKGQLRSFYKPGGSEISDEILSRCLGAAKKRTKEMIKKIEIK
jgi:exosome complex component RRP43